ncbi:GNAT family N-acetyltransferase [Vibrio hepatarius]|uniref:GNAT family N-acetyltransferase n=1 Tax=Vibrio hepatarius TaxID=171383 RepID=UPI001C08D5FC|nr:GNAT family N-acetyltransferase [Vibrio hepatarius]MBU2899348.1 GNAT family N-acetyltransferase [Vibrio hepatarius]
MKKINFLHNVELYEGDIIIRTARPSDVEEITNYYLLNKAHLAKWEPERDENFFTTQGWHQILYKFDELSKNGSLVYFIILDRQSAKMIGTISFSNICRFPFHCCKLDYSLSKSVQGRGIMTKALRIAVNYMFQVQNIHRISASVMPKNARSKAVLNHLEFKSNGFAKDYLLINKHWEDHELVSLLNPNWNNPHVGQQPSSSSSTLEPS